MVCLRLRNGGHPVFGLVLDCMQEGGFDMTMAMVLFAAAAGIAGGLSAFLGYRNREKAKTLESWLMETVKSIENKN